MLLTDKDFNMSEILGDKKDWPLEAIQKSNIVRLWYVYQHGGISADFETDIEYLCLKSHLPHRGFYQWENSFFYASEPKS